MIRQKSLIGTEIDCTFRTIEESQLTRLHHAIHQSSSFFSAKPDASSKDETFHHLPAFLLGNLINLPKVYKALGLNINNILLSRESVTHHRPLKSGSSVTIRTFLKDAYEQQASSNPIGFIVLDSIGHLDMEVAFHCERVIAVRGGFQRGRP